MRRFLVLILGLLVLLSACTRDDGEQAAMPDGAGQEAAAATPDGPDAVAAAEAEPEAAAPEPGGTAEPEGSAAAEAASGGAAPRPSAATARPGLRIVAADVVIGPLEDRLAGPRDVITVIEDLFTALGEDRIPAELLAADVRADLEHRLSYMTAQASIRRDVRIGSLTALSASAYRAPVAVFGREGGRTSGEIYVAQSDGSWYISDILVDFTRIDAEQSTPVLEPGTGGPTLLSF